MKYNIEGGVDFYAELNKIEEDEASGVVDDSKKCLITRLPLTEDSIKMECGHEFNYSSLYNELVQQLKPSICGYAKSGRIVCPYCRHSQQTFLPFNPAYKPVIGVNVYPHRCIKLDTLELCVDATIDMCEMSSTNKCNPNVVYKLPSGEHYCEFHKMIGLSIVKQKAFHQAFLTKKAEIDEKAMKKQAKLNVVCCTQLLKSGIRKGQQCGCKKVIEGTTVCSRHHLPTNN